MQGFYRTASWAALICAATYLFGIVLMVSVLVPAGYDAPDKSPAELLAFLRAQQVTLSIWYLVIYVLNAIALGALVISLSELLRSANAVLARLSAGFGLMWATLVMGAGMIANVGLAATVSHGGTPEVAAQMWSTISTIENGLGGGNEIAGAVWVITISLAAWASGVLPRGLNIIGVVIGACGLLTLIPALEAFGMIFGLGFIVWFGWVGVALRRQRAL